MEAIDLVLKILAFVFMVPGFGIIYGARRIVERYRLYEKMQCPFEQELSEDELREYKFDKALLNVKFLGLAVAVPGIVLLFVSFS